MERNSFLNLSLRYEVKYLQIDKICNWKTPLSLSLSLSYEQIW